MSAEATFWAWRQAGLGSTAKMVLLCLADCHNSSTGRCDPSAKYIADKSDLNVKSIYSAIKKLSEMGLLEVKKRVGTSTEYQLKIPRYTESLPQPKTGQPKNGSTQKRVTGTPEKGSGVDPKTGHKPITEPKKKPKIIKKEIVLPDCINPQAWAEWVKYRKENKTAVSYAAAQKQFGLLKDYTFLEQQIIIDNSIQNDYQGLFKLKPEHRNAESKLRPTANSRAQDASAEYKRQLAERAANLTSGSSTPGSGHGQSVGRSDEPAGQQVYEPVRGGGPGDVSNVVRLSG